MITPNTLTSNEVNRSMIHPQTTAVLAAAIGGQEAIPRNAGDGDDSTAQGCQVSDSSRGCGSSVIGCVVRACCGVANVPWPYPRFKEAATLQVSGNGEIWSRGWLLHHKEETGNPVE